MRVAMVGPFGFHPNKTMRSRAFPLGRALVSAGHQVKIWLPPWQTPQEAGRDWEEEGVAIRTVSLSGGTSGVTLRMVRQVRAWRPDVVHTFKPKAYSGLVAWWLWTAGRRALPLVTDSDDWEGAGGWNDLAPYSAVQKQFFAWQERWGLRHCHALTVASRTLESLAWAAGVPPGRVFYLPNGPGIRPPAREAAARPSGRPPTLLLYSRLFEFGTVRAVDVLARVRAAVPELAVTLVGLGLYEEQAAGFRRQLEAAGLAEIVEDKGWLTEEELPAALASADAAFFPMDDTLLNRTKCPVKLADLLQAGLPVAAEAVGQAREYVEHGRTGLLVPPGDGPAMAEALIALLGDAGLRQRLGRAAAARIHDEFSWQRLARTAEMAYGRAVSAASR
jgi:glycosyltransferase involved in cell wall biosynthesis